MKNPYQILEASEQASDAEIKQAYLQKVKQFPPEHHHEQFQLVRRAYELIKDLESRSKYALFAIPEADFNELLEQAFGSGPALSISAEQFEKLLGASVDNKIFNIAASETVTAR